MGVFFSEAELSGGVERSRPRWLREADRPLYIFGAGRGGRIVLSALSNRPELRKRIAGFLDNNPALAGMAVEGVPVLPVDGIPSGGPAPVVIVSTHTREARIAMHGECHRLGYESVPWERALREMYHGQVSAALLEGWTRATEALDIWADEESRRVYRSRVRLQATCAAADVPERPDGPQYFHPCVPYHHYRSFLDGGAFDGDTFGVFRNYVANEFDRYYAIEPGTAVRDALTAAIDGNPRVEMYVFALMDKAGDVSFHDDSGMGSKVIGAPATNTATVPARTIDSILDGRPVSLIKLDVEGSEPAALRGALETITRRRPALAVCTYHWLDQLWEIPLWIRELDLGYRLHCAHYSIDLSETVCYAVPE